MCHIELGLDYTKLWYVDGHATKPVELPYYPIVDQIFGELTRESNTITPIPAEAREIQVDLLLPLTDREKVEHHEAKLQMQSFVSKEKTLTPTPEKKPIEDDLLSESTEEDINVLLKGLEELDFDHPHIQKKVLQRACRIWSNVQPTQTRVMKRKRSELPTLGPEGKVAIEQAR